MIIFVLSACDVFEESAGSWIDQPPSCDADPYAWSDDLVTYLSAGSGDGSFDLDPTDEPRSDIAGAYDPSAGEFAYDVRFADDYFIVAESVEDGVGTAWHNGDLDVEYVSKVEDKLGEKIGRASCRERVYVLV